jgi:FO synthase subunit 1
MPARKCSQAGGVQTLDALTYSRNLFIPVTDLCRNRCKYCSFRRGPKEARVIKKSAALALLQQGAKLGCSEVLFSMGERPWEAEGFGAAAEEAGMSDIIQHLLELCQLSLEMGHLPHTNAGVLSDEHLKALSPYNASMGLMLETTARVDAHTESPGKVPEARLDFIERAGRLKVPLTTGILVGIGEGWEDRRDSLRAIADLHRAYGHIQEVIVQPLDPKPGTPMAQAERPDNKDLLQTVALARAILPREVAVQVPPNLVDPLPLVQAGASDLGGISPLTPDWINPQRPWPDLEDLRRKLRGYRLRERLAVYPRYVQLGWYGRQTRSVVEALAGVDGLRRKEYL